MSGSKRTPTVGISVPQLVVDGEFDPRVWQAHLARIEALGFDSVWTIERILGTEPVLSPFETLGYAAACTQRVRLGCAVVLSALRSPVHLAKSVATLDQLSRGRVEIGVGLGRPGPTLAAFGIERADIAARYTEGLEVMKACWTEPRVTIAGTFWNIEGAAVQPPPFQKPHPPLWFGARARPALARAVRLGDGFIGAGSSTTVQFGEQMAIIQDDLAKAGRDPATFRRAKRVYITVDDDIARARDRARAGLCDIYGPERDLTPVAVVGPPEQCVEGLREVVDLGAETLVLNPLDDDAAQLERLAGEVVPYLAG